MPELPEVESVLQMLRDARPSLIGRRVERLLVIWDGVVACGSADALRQQLSGAVFATAERLGKYMIFGVDSVTADHGRRRYLIIHLRMTGRLFLVPNAEAVDRYTRLSLLLDQE